MKRTIAIEDCGKGLNADLLPAELELGVWSNVKNFRVRNGFMEKWEGEYQLSLSSLSVSFPLIIYSYKDADSLIFVHSTGVAVHRKWSTATNTTITRYRKSETISTLNRLGANSAEVTTASAHGLTTGDVVTVFGATESGYNEVGASITVTSTTKFTYTTTVAIAANATVVGEYVVTSSSATSGFSSTSAEQFSGGDFNGVAIINDSVNGLHYWDGNTSNKFRRFGFQSYLADYCGFFREYIVQLQPTMSGTKYPYRVLWSNATEPGSIPSSFTSSTTNDAGFQDLAYAGPLITCLPLGDANYIYSRTAIVAMRYIGGEFVFSFQKTADVGAISQHAVCDVPGVGHVFVTPSLDVRVHQGGATRSIADGFVRNALQSDYNNTSSEYDFIVRYNPQKNEVLITPSNAYLTRSIYAWDVESGRWATFDLGFGYAYSCMATCVVPTDSTYLASGAGSYDAKAQSTVVVGGGLRMALLHPSLSVGYISGNQIISGTLERIGLHWGIRDRNKTIHRTRWNIDGDAADTVTISHGAASTSDATPTYASGVTYTIGTTDYCSQRSLSGRFNALKLVTTAYPVKIRSIDVELTTEGTR